MPNPATAETTSPDNEGDPSNVVPLREGDAKVAVDRKAEGGLTLRFAFDLPKIPSVMTVQTWTHQQMLNGALLLAVLGIGGFLVYEAKFAPAAPAPVEATAVGEPRPNALTSFSPAISHPTVSESAYIDPFASVIGSVQVGSGVFIAPFASVRGDEGQPVVIGDGSNVQDGVVIHALETFDGSKIVDANLVTVDGKKYAVWIGSNVSLAHQSQVHGPAAVGNGTFVGMQSLVFKATVGENVVIEPGSKIIGVNIPAGRYVPAGSVITSQAAADELPEITPEYPFATLNDGVLHVNHEFADAYLDAAHGGSGGGAGAPAAAHHP
jgi:carbonic anhydrase/acetyltransferase-like protein (isoleucine patch superfamily)